jgi:hypothetical protein
LETNPQEKLLVFKTNPREGGINGQDSQRILVKTRRPSDHKEVAHRLNLDVQRESPRAIEIRLIGDRGLVRSVTLCIRNREFPIVMEAWAQAFAMDRRQVASEIGDRRFQECEFFAFQTREL